MDEEVDEGVSVAVVEVTEIETSSASTPRSAAASTSAEAGKLSTCFALPFPPATIRMAAETAGVV